MEKTKNLPWSFTVVFDEKKAKDNGYTTDELYDYVDEVVAQYRALSTLSKDPMIMKSIASLMFFERGINPHDFLEITRRLTPERLYA